MCSADRFVNAHRWVASAALAPRSAVGLIEGVATSFSDGTFRERKRGGAADVLHASVKRVPTNFSTRAMRDPYRLFLAAAPRSDA